jgi:hypothetical protein
LLPAFIDTRWFHDFCWPTDQNADVYPEARWGHNWSYVGAVEHDLYIKKGRLQFYHPGLKPGYTLTDYKLFGEQIFDFTKPHVKGPAPRGGNIIAVFHK